MNQRVAIIDLGTNTFHLAIADVQGKEFTFLYRERLPVKIGMGGINDGIITNQAIERALDALQIFKATIKSYNVNHVLAFGTSAMRNARNGAEIAERIKDATGIECKIITGEEEAHYIYYGVRAAVPLGKEKSLIVDIGGGSVEFIIGNEEGIFWKQSFEIGAQRLLERFQKNDPIRETELAELNVYFEKSLTPLFDALQLHPVKTLVGSSGTFDTLSDIYCIRTDVTVTMPETPLTVQAFYDIYEEFLQKNREERLLIPGMIEMRVDMIVVACALIDFLLKSYPFKNIRVSTYSLKEGVLVSLTQ